MITRKAKHVKPKRPNYFNTPKGFLILTLLGLAVIAYMGSGSKAGLIHVGIAVLSAVVLDVIFALFQERSRIVPDGAVLTGIIIGMVMSALAPLWTVAAASGIAIMSKHLLKIGRKPIFNPAALGLFASIFLFASEQSWWGGLTEIPAWCIVFVLIAGYLIVRRVNKFPQVFAFLGTYYGLLLVIALEHYAPVGSSYLVPFMNSALFLAFFMLTDPPTSPGKYPAQIVFGFLAALVAVSIQVTQGGLAYLLGGLLTANLFNAALVGIKAIRKPKKHVKAFAAPGGNEDRARQNRFG